MAAATAAAAAATTAAAVLLTGVVVAGAVVATAVVLVEAAAAAAAGDEAADVAKFAAEMANDVLDPLASAVSTGLSQVLLIGCECGLKRSGSRSGSLSVVF